MYRNVLQGQRCASQQLPSANKMEITSVTEDAGVGGWVGGTELAPS